MKNHFYYILISILLSPFISFSQNTDADIKKTETEIKQLFYDLGSNLSNIVFTFRSGKTSIPLASNFYYEINSYKPTGEIGYWAQDGGDKYKFNFMDIDVAKIKTENNIEFNSTDVILMLNSKSGIFNSGGGGYIAPTEYTDKIILHLKTANNATYVISLIKDIIKKCNLRNTNVETKKQNEANAILKSKNDFDDCKNVIEKAYNDGINKIKQGNFEGALQDLKLASDKCNEAYIKTHEGDKPFKKYREEINNLSNKISDQTILVDTRIEIIKWDKEIKENPQNAEAYRHRGNCRVALIYNAQTDIISKDSLCAIEDLNKAIELNPKSDSAYFSRGFFKGIVFSDYKGGVADFNKAIKLNPKYELAYLHRAGIRGEMGDEKGQNADMKKSNELLKEEGKK